MNMNSNSSGPGESRPGEAGGEVAQLRSRLADAERRLEELQSHMKEGDRRIEDFLATVAHELRNPLAPVRNAIHILRVLDPSAPEATQAQDIIERQVEQMTRIVDDMLDLSRIARGQVVLHREPVDLTSVIDAAVETSQALIETRRHTLDIVLPQQTVVLDADFGRLAQVFANLLNNAAKYTNHGGQISIIARLDDDDFVDVSVRDNGIGIAPNDLPHVFEMRPHSTGDVETARAGLGIGLALVKHLLALHGAEITAHSEGTGTGSEFRVRLPVSAVQDETAPAVDSGLLDEIDTSPAPAVRVLLAEDDEDSAMSLALLLEHYGCTTRVVHDGLTALQVGAEFHPQVVLLDIGMPGIDGWETCRRMRKEPWGRKALAIALTGWGQDEDRRRTMEAGFDHHLVKPVRVTSLLDVFAGRATVNAG
jgi:signal transduction histidine kinase/ActR/RegA family two-component response regulator